MVVSRQRPGLRRLPRQPSLTDGMEISPGCTSLLPLMRMPPRLGTDQIPAARCFFWWCTTLFRASSRSGLRVASFLFAHCAVPNGIFIPSVMTKKWNDMIQTKTLLWPEIQKSFVWASRSRLSRFLPALPRRHPMKTRTRPSDGDATVLCQSSRSASRGRSTTLPEEIPPDFRTPKVFSSCHARLANLQIERRKNDYSAQAGIRRVNPRKDRGQA